MKSVHSSFTHLAKKDVELERSSAGLVRRSITLPWLRENVESQKED